MVVKVTSGSVASMAYQQTSFSNSRPTKLPLCPCHILSRSSYSHFSLTFRYTITSSPSTLKTHTSRAMYIFLSPGGNMVEYHTCTPWKCCLKHHPSSLSEEKMILIHQQSLHISNDQCHTIIVTAQKHAQCHLELVAFACLCRTSI